MIPQVIEEIFRLYAFANPMRVMAENLDFEGVQLREGASASSSSCRPPIAMPRFPASR
jgi:hypothetical protein